MSIRLSLSKRKKLKTEITHAKGEVRQQGGVTETLVDKEEPSSLKISNESSSLDNTNDESEPSSKKISSNRLSLSKRKKLKTEITHAKGEVRQQGVVTETLVGKEEPSSLKISNESSSLDITNDESEPFSQKMDKEVSQLQINMKIRKELQEKIAIMKKEWLQRKRKCLDFLEHLEHSSDGEITADMCFNGHQNAPFKLKSDKEAITEALDEYNSKTNQPVKVPKKKKIQKKK